MDRLRALKGRYAGRRAYVMGNGPSLLKCDLNLLANEVTIVSNAHYLIWDQLTYVPTIMAVEDRLVAEDRGPEIRELTGITKIFPYDLRYALGPAAQDHLYINFPREYAPQPQFSFDLAKRAYWGGTVTFLNIQIAAYLGCSPIILIGLDHSYVVPKTTDGYVITSEGDDVNHIHPDYFGKGYRWHDPNVARMERAYECARDALAAAGVQVLNATVGGHLEVFPRMRFESTLENT